MKENDRGKTGNGWIGPVRGVRFRVWGLGSHRPGVHTSVSPTSLGLGASYLTSLSHDVCFGEMRLAIVLSHGVVWNNSADDIGKDSVCAPA